MHEVPNWLNWVISIATILVLGWNIGRWFWQRWLSDRWAKRNQEAAKSKAEVLVKQFREALFLPDNELKMHAISTQIVTEILMGIVLFLAGVGWISIIFAFAVPVSDAMAGAGLAVGVFILLIALTRTVDALDMRQRYILPYTSWVDYYDKTLNRIRSLLSDAGLSDEEQGNFIDRVVGSIDEEEEFFED